MNHRIGPFWVTNEEHIIRKAFKSRDGERRFVVGIAAAREEDGLIGPEQNGLFVLDDDRLQVLLDRDTEQVSGYYGPSQEQIARLDEVNCMEWDEFRDFVNTHDKCRLQI